MGHDTFKIKAPEAGFILPDRTSVPAAVVDPSPELPAVLWTAESWADFWARKGAVYSRVCGSLFPLLQEHDSDPSDHILDVSSLSNDQLSDLSDHVSIACKGEADCDAQQDAKDYIFNMMRGIRSYQRVMVATRSPTMWHAADENGFQVDLSPAWTPVLDHIQNKTGEKLVRVVIDKRLFQDYENNALNPARAGAMRSALYDASLVVTGGMGLYEPKDTLEVMPSPHRLAGFGAGDFENTIMVAAIVVTSIAFLFGKGRGAAMPMPSYGVVGTRPVDPRFDFPEAPSTVLERVQTGLQTGGRFMRSAIMVPRRWAAERFAKPAEPVEFKNTPTLLPTGVNQDQLTNSLTGQVKEVDGARMRLVSDDGQVVGFVEFKSDGLVSFPRDATSPVFLPIETARRSVSTGERQVFHAPNGGFWFVEPAYSAEVGENLGDGSNPMTRPGRGVVIGLNVGSFNPAEKSPEFKPSVTLPWVEGWMNNSPATYHPYTGNAADLLPREWNGTFPMTITQHSEVADHLLARLEGRWSTLPEFDRDAVETLSLVLRDGRVNRETRDRIVNVMLEGDAAAATLLRAVSQELISFRGMTGSEWLTVEPSGTDPWGTRQLEMDFASILTQRHQNSIFFPTAPAHSEPEAAMELSPLFLSDVSMQVNNIFMLMPGTNQSTLVYPLIPSRSTQPEAVEETPAFLRK